jgi:hypothetical protein
MMKKLYTLYTRVLCRMVAANVCRCLDDAAVNIGSAQCKAGNSPQ